MVNKIPTSICTKYFDFADVFSPELASKPFEHTGINDHVFKLVNNQQPPYGPIYSLGQVKLKTLKTYIETNLANSLIRSPKSPARTPIFFDKKPDGSLRRCVDYRGLNNLKIKNQYLLLLVRESLDRLGQVRQFTQLELTNAYYRMRICKEDE